MSALPTRPLSAPVLIGREREVAVLQALIDEAHQGRGQVLLLSGEAGIGKSRLLAEGVRQARALGWLVLQGACFPTDRAAPYAPLLDLLSSPPARALLVPTTTDPLPLAGEVARQFPGLLPLTGDAPPLPMSDPAQEQRRFFSALTRFFTDLAAHQPVLLAFEDLHWSDETSLAYLHHLARHCPEHPLLLVLTYRNDEVGPGLRTWLAHLDRDPRAHELLVPPLARQDIAALLHVLMAGQRLPPALLDTLSALTEGNPFFIEELLQSLITVGAIGSAPAEWAGEPLANLPIPRSVQDAVQQRLERLSEAARQVVTVAAVAGRRFDFAVLQQITHYDEADLLALMKELIAAQLVVEATEEHFAFRHALTCEAVARQLLLRERKALHRAIAAAIEARGVSAPEAHLSELAYHCSEAGLWEKALSYAEQAGERALALDAPRVAIEQFTRALKASHYLAGAPVARLYHRRGQAYKTRGDFAHARADYDRALQASRDAQDVQMEWQVIMALGVLWAGRDYEQAGTFFRQAVDLAQQLGDPTPYAHSLNRLGNWLVNTGQVAEGLVVHRQALAVFDQQHDRVGMAETHDLLGQALAWSGDAVKGAEQRAHAIALFRQLGDQKHLISALTYASLTACPAAAETVAVAVQDPAQGERDLAEAAFLARQIEWPDGEAFAELTWGTLLLSRGQFGRSLAHTHRALQLAQAIDHQEWTVGAYGQLGQIAIAMGAPALALRQLAAGVSLAHALGSAWFLDTLRAYQALAHLDAGQHAAAVVALRPVRPHAQEPQTLSARTVAWVWGELLLAQGTPQDALAVADRLLATAPGGPHSQPIPRLLMLKGEALVALQRPAEAVAALEEAKSGAQERHEAPLLWQIHAALGRVYRLLKRDQDAREALTAARDGIEALAQTIEDAEMRTHFTQRALAALPRVKPISPRRAAAHQFGGLTAREREVAALIAQGQTNRAIAAQLVVSERTAEGHVNNILGKLGFTSRAQIAVWAVERGLTHR